MIVRLFRHVPAPPEIPFQLADEMDAPAENVQVGQPVVPPQITLDPRDPRKQVLVHIRIDEDVPLVKEFAHALDAGQGMLFGGAVDERAHPPLVIPLPAQQSADPLDLRGVIIDVPARFEVLVHDVHVVVVIDGVPMGGQRIVLWRCCPAIRAESGRAR